MTGSREEVVKEDSPKPSLEATPEPPPQPDPQLALKESQWEVLATSAVVEYFHTGNLVDALSSSHWKEAAEAKHDDARDENGDDQRYTNPIFDSPPKELSVSLYAESDPENSLAVVNVPRWLSDGVVWEVCLSPSLFSSDKRSATECVRSDMQPFVPQNLHAYIGCVGRKYSPVCCSP